MRLLQLLAGKGLLVREEAERILNGENQDPAWFGTLAFLLGYLERDDIDRVLRGQRDSDLRFGEQALHMGLLRDGEGARVLRLQQENRVLFTEVAWLLEHLEIEEIKRYLAELLA